MKHLIETFEVHESVQNRIEKIRDRLPTVDCPWERADLLKKLSQLLEAERVMSRELWKRAA